MEEMAAARKNLCFARSCSQRWEPRPIKKQVPVSRFGAGQQRCIFTRVKRDGIIKGNHRLPKCQA